MGDTYDVTSWKNFKITEEMIKVRKEASRTHVLAIRERSEPITRKVLSEMEPVWSKIDDVVKQEELNRPVIHTLISNSKSPISHRQQNQQRLIILRNKLFPLPIDRKRDSDGNLKASIILERYKLQKRTLDFSECDAYNHYVSDVDFKMEVDKEFEFLRVWQSNLQSSDAVNI